MCFLQHVELFHYSYGLLESKFESDLFEIYERFAPFSEPFFFAFSLLYRRLLEDNCMPTSQRVFFTSLEIIRDHPTLLSAIYIQVFEPSPSFFL